MTEQSDTPRTDAECSDGWSGDAICVSEEFSRQLERELNAAHAWHAEMIRINRGLTEQIAKLQGELTQWKNDVAHQGLILATICDMVLGENADDRSDDALMRGVRKLLNDLDEAKLPRLEEVQMPNVMARIAELESELSECYAMLADSMCWCRDNPAKYQSGRCMRAVQSKIREYDSLVKFLSVSSDRCSAATQQHSQPKQ